MCAHCTYVCVHACECTYVYCLLTQRSMVGTMKGDLAGLDTFTANVSNDAKQSSSGGIFGIFKALSGGKTITMEALQPILEKMKEHLIGVFQSCDQGCIVQRPHSDKLYFNMTYALLTTSTSTLHHFPPLQLRTWQWRLLASCVTPWQPSSVERSLEPSLVRQPSSDVGVARL